MTTKVITREDLTAWALGEVHPYLKRGYTTYVREVVSSVIMKARDEFPGYQMDPRDPGIPAHVRQSSTTTSEQEYIARIQQLERLNASLSAQVDRQARVVEAAITWNETNYRNQQEIEIALDALSETCDSYQAAMAALAKGGGGE